MVKILHWMLTHTLNARKSIDGHVSVQDMVLLKVVMDGRQVDIVKWLIYKLLKIRDEKVKIQFTMIATFIVLNLEISFEDNDRAHLRKFKVNHWINTNAL